MVQMALTTTSFLLMLTLLNRATITCHGQPLPSFPNGSPWQSDISDPNYPLDPQSAATTSWLQAAGGWGYGRLQIDPSIVVLDANCNTPRVPFVKKDGYYVPDCDDVTNFPVPLIGGIEGTTVDWNEAASCEGDCHLIVHDVDSGMIWESYDTTVTVTNNVVTQVSSSCVVVWNTNQVYPSDGRGDGCTSADAAGFPISTLLFTPEEIQAQSIDHAIRFILPNNRMRALSYAHPGSHFGAPGASIASAAPIYGSRWRLKANFDISGYSPAAQIILRALKKHGMFLSDGGNIALTKASDAFRTLKWADVGLAGARPFDNIVPTNFEVVQAFGDFPRDYGRDIPANGRPDCVPNNIPVVYDPVCPAPMPNLVPVQLPTSAPVTPPAKAPVKALTAAPVKPPTKAPVKAPTVAPVKPPTKAPVKSPTRAPVKAPTKAPVKAPTKSPVKQPTKAPIKAPTSKPVKPTRPVKSPTKKPRRVLR